MQLIFIVSHPKENILISKLQQLHHTSIHEVPWVCSYCYTRLFASSYSIIYMHVNYLYHSDIQSTAVVTYNKIIRSKMNYSVCDTYLLLNTDIKNNHQCAHLCSARLSRTRKEMKCQSSLYYLQCSYATYLGSKLHIRVLAYSYWFCYTSRLIQFIACSQNKLHNYIANTKILLSG